MQRGAPARAIDEKGSVVPRAIHAKFYNDRILMSIVTLQIAFEYVVGKRSNGWTSHNVVRRMLRVELRCSLGGAFEEFVD